MTPYETMFILDARNEAEAGTILDGLRANLAEIKAEIHREEPWGRREMCYDLAKRRDGWYHVLWFNADPLAMTEFKKTLEANPRVTRYLLSRLKAFPPERQPEVKPAAQVTTPESVPASSPVVQPAETVATTEVA